MRALMLCAVLVLSVTVHVVAQDTFKYGQVGSWEIRMDSTMGYGCFAYTNFVRGTSFRIGFDNSAKIESMYIMVGDPEWKSLETGKKYDLVMDFGSETVWTGTGIALWLGDKLPVLRVNIPGDMLQEFMEKQGVDVRYRDQSIANLSLKDSWAAGQKILECQNMIRDHQKRNPPRKKDPFSSAKSSDPFAR